jgi:hypothetical protein
MKNKKLYFLQESRKVKLLDFGGAVTRPSSHNLHFITSHGKRLQTLTAVRYTAVPEKLPIEHGEPY